MSDDNRKFSEVPDREIYSDLWVAEETGKIRRIIGTPEARWCCSMFDRRHPHYIMFPNGTKMRVVRCPSCGREL